MLTEALLSELFPRAPDAHRTAFAALNANLFQRYGIDAGRFRLQFFLAQVGHESGGLTLLTENLNYRAERLVQVWPKRFPNLAAARPYAGNPEALANKVYGGRMGNGPESTGDGWRYHGRGYIQLTGRDAYQAVGRIANLDLPGHPDIAIEPRHALEVVCAFWQWKGLNAVCDTGDFVTLTRRINGGTVGLTDRKAWLDKVRRVLSRPAATRGEPPSAARVIAIQRALQTKGIREVGAADGSAGPRTLAAIERYRHEHGLADGQIDATLERSLGIAD